MQIQVVIVSHKAKKLAIELVHEEKQGLELFFEELKRGEKIFTMGANWSTIKITQQVLCIVIRSATGHEQQNKFIYQGNQHALQKKNL